MDLVSLIRNNWQVSLLVLGIVIVLYFYFMEIPLTGIIDFLTNNIYWILLIGVVGYVFYVYRFQIILFFVRPNFNRRPPFRNALNPPR
jgi:hypothetical protein